MGIYEDGCAGPPDPIAILSRDHACARIYRPDGDIFLLACLIKRFVTAGWWKKMFDLIEIMAREIPCYDMEFDRSGKVADKLMELTE